MITNAKIGTDGQHATYTIDLSQIPNTTNSQDLENVIQMLRYHAINYTYEHFLRPEIKGGVSWQEEIRYEFVDTSDKRSFTDGKIADALYKFHRTIDLASVRNDVSAGGKTIRQALADAVAKSMAEASPTIDTNGNIVLHSINTGSAANQETIDAREGQLVSYDVDFGAWFQKNAGKEIPSYFNGKGFRWYCATDSKQWFNIIFDDGSMDVAGRVKSGTQSEDIKSIIVDVSSVKTAEDMVNAIYDQVEPILTGSDPDYNHLYRMKADSKKGVLTIYDMRGLGWTNPIYKDKQEKGAKIADGIYDNVVKGHRAILAEEIVIQHTDHASMNIHLHIPRTTFDQIFGYVSGSRDVSEFNVMTKSMREELLGTSKNEPGLLEEGLSYLTNAQTLLGAQYNHLEHAHDTVTAQQESTTASESAIRDADMAKEMTDYMKLNLLSQAAEAMTAQANKSLSNVLGLMK